MFPKDKSVVGYLSFASSHNKDEKYAYVRYVFVGLDGDRKELIINEKDISSNNMVFDDGIWI